MPTSVRNSVRLIALIVVTAAVASCESQRRENPSTDSTGVAKNDSAGPPHRQITIAQWGQERYLIYLPLYVAMEEGLFAKRGIDVSLKYSGNDDQTFATVLRGDALFGVGDPAFAAIATERGQPAKVIATIVGGVAIWGVTNKPNVPVVQRAADLRGLRVGTFPEPSTNYTLMRTLIDNTSELRSSTSIVQAPIGSQLALLESGRADIGMELEPATSIAEGQGYRVVYSSPRFHGPFAFTGLTTTDEILRTNGDIAHRTVAALEEAVQLCHRDAEVCVGVARRVLPTLSETVVRNAVRRMLNEHTLPPHVVTSDSAWQAALRVRLEVGDLQRAQPTSLVVDNTYALAAQGGGATQP